jgi:hypothetical protein
MQYHDLNQNPYAFLEKVSEVPRSKKIAIPSFFSGKFKFKKKVKKAYISRGQFQKEAFHCSKSLTFLFSSTKGQIKNIQF